jgi:hypothetical protein
MTSRFLQHNSCKNIPRATPEPLTHIFSDLNKLSSVCAGITCRKLYSLHSANYDNVPDLFDREFDYVPLYYEKVTGITQGNPWSNFLFQRLETWMAPGISFLFPCTPLCS